MNVIVVDWQYWAKDKFSNAVKKYKNVGLKIAQLIDWLIDMRTPISSFHLIGFSLGAHIVGKTGRSVTKGKIPYITGLIETIEKKATLIFF